VLRRRLQGQGAADPFCNGLALGTCEAKASTHHALYLLAALFLQLLCIGLALLWLWTLLVIGRLTLPRVFSRHCRW